MISDNHNGINDIESFLADIDGKDLGTNTKNRNGSLPDNLTEEPGYNYNDPFLNDIDTPEINKADEFTANKEEFKDILDLLKKEPEHEKEEKPPEKPAEQKSIHDTQKINKPVPAEKSKTQIFIIKGTKSWNTREPYLLDLDNKKLEDNLNDLNKTFYFSQKQQKETVTIGEMKRSMFIFIRGAAENIRSDYSGFLSKTISSQMHELVNRFGITNDRIHLFVYHLGILTIFKLLLNIFQSTGLGFCYKLLKTKDNSVVKYLPSEFIKELSINWHNNYFADKSIQFDSIFEYNELKKQISTHYLQEIGKNSAELESINKNITNSAAMKDEEKKRIKESWSDLFGIPKIMTYNRFIEQTIFKLTG